MSRWIALTMILGSFLIPAPALATYPGQNGVIAFDLELVDYQVEGITVMNADGSGQHMITDRGHAASWSADGSTIYFDNGGIWSIHPDGSGLSRVTEPGQQWLDWHPWPMPDGSVVFQSNRGEKFPFLFHIWRKVPGQRASPLTTSRASDVSPVVSPDGSQIAFVRSCTYPRSCGTNLVVMNADGTNVRLLVRDIDSSASIDWSPDGTMISFGALVYGPEQGIFLVNVETGKVSRVGDLLSFEAGWTSIEFAPDNSKLLVVSGSQSGSTMFTVNFDGSDLQYIPVCCGELYFGRAAWQPL